MSLSLGIVAAVAPDAGAAQEFRVDLDQDNRVKFISDAPLEDFEGVTDRIDGFVLLAGEGLGGETDLAKSEFYFEVDLASIDTGIGLRNRHMRNNYLETDRFPYAAFQGRLTELASAQADDFRAIASGTLTIHGVDRPRDIECSVSPVGPGHRVRCEFTVALSDHEIRIPKLMFMKIDELMRLELEFFLTQSDPETGRSSDRDGMDNGEKRRAQ